MIYLVEKAPGAVIPEWARYRVAIVYGIPPGDILVLVDPDRIERQQ